MITRRHDSKPKLIVRSLDDKAKVLEFIKRIQPRGASIHFETNASVWLLKPTDKGGVTLARIVDLSKDEAVEQMIHTIWADAQKGY